MKYSIFGFDQQTLCDINAQNEKKLDCTDLVIIQWVAEFIARERTKKVMLDGNMYAWVSQATLAEDFPFFSFTKRTFADRLDKLSEIGIVEKRVERQKGYGTFTYLRLTSMYDNLLYSRGGCEGDAVQTPSGCGSNHIGGAVQTPPKDLYTINPSNETKEESKPSAISYEDVRLLWNNTCTMLPDVSVISANRQEKIRSRFKEFSSVGEPMEVYKTLLGKITKSTFLTQQSRTNWRKKIFDWLFENPQNWVKVWEGQYDDDGSSNTLFSDNNDNALRSAWGTIYE